jgi:hypothetical protein
MYLYKAIDKIVVHISQLQKSIVQYSIFEEYML